MALRTDMLKGEVIEKVVEAVDARMSGKKASFAEAFVRRFYENVAPSDIVSEETEDLYGAALSLWGFAATRKPKTAKVRVYNPGFDHHGWHSTHTVVEIVHDDMPFLVDSVSADLNRSGITIHQLIHPIFVVNRNKDGKALSMSAVEDDGNGAVRESCIHIQIDEQPTEKARKALEMGLRGVLSDVRAAVGDWHAMRQKVVDELDRLKKNPPKLAKAEVEEGAAFLSWVHDDHFTFLGYRELSFTGKGKRARIEVVPNSGLGVLRDPDVAVFEGLRNLGAQTPEVQAFVRQPRLLLITKATERSTVHRSVHMDAIVIKLLDEKGVVVGERLFVGLFTSVAYSETPTDIPLLRQKVAAVVENSGFDAGSHDGKALMHVLEDYSRDELFQSDLDALTDVAHGIVRLQERQRIALFLRRDPYERYVSAMVYLPRERLNTGLRQNFEAILSRAFNGVVREVYTHVTDELLGRWLFIVKTTPGAIPDYDVKEIEARLTDSARTWQDRLAQALIENLGEARGNQLFKKYGESFPTGYREIYSAQTAVFDIAHIEESFESGALGMNLYRPIEAEEDELSFKIYNVGAPIALSDILPRLENMGLKVVREVPADIFPASAERPVYLHDFGLVTGDGSPVDYTAVRQIFHDNFARVWLGDVEDDGFNRLVLRASLDWREVVMLRAYCKYLRQARIPFSQAYMEETLARYPDLTRLLIRLFKLRFDPDFEGDREQLEISVQAAINQELDRVVNLDEDRILRRYLNLIQQTIRTNFFQTMADGSPVPYLSFKLNSREIDDLPEPRPLREISVYSPRFEAVHLRFGMVARGGLRWSDRREDFRTEILGLVKAQQVKNAVIVPVGSKGGFVLKKVPLPNDREAFQAEGVACYQLFVRAMLEITDNLVDGEIAPPEQVVRKDEDDAYLVVAADKGTATFSDIANEIAVSQGYWLGDAFASGGSEGYDHKKMGITARGAWESVKRHFREMDHDTQSAPFTVVGCGDMSGDVFGNGMLLSEHIRLVGAFNHLHIFIDPNPDTAASFAERKRLFDLPRSSWSDYDESLLSAGGGIIDRNAKSVTLTAEMRELFGIAEATLTPNALISAMLRAEVDLLWFGGIGTYVKSSAESQGDAGDRANDGLRVDGNQLRCKVVGEGANLGVTQNGRIEYARAGGRINSDSIDNSAGVDCSDHEVNIKIALGSVVRRGDMTDKQRNSMLVEMTDDVGRLCLEDNYAQTQAITVEESQAYRLLDRHQRLMRSLERAGNLDRGIEFLPDDETIDALESTKLGLTRPEIAILLAYAKNATYEELLQSNLPDDPLLEGDLSRYFPMALRERNHDSIEQHTLRREIIATSVTNSMINHTGPTFMNEMRDRTGLDSPEIARAYTVVREAFRLRALWAEIEALDNKVSTDAQTLMLREIGRTVDRTTQWFLRNADHPLDITKLMEEFAPGIKTLAARMDDILRSDQREDVARRTTRFVSPGVPDSLSQRIGALKMLSTACDIIRIAGDADVPVIDTAQTYFAVGSRFRLDWLRRGANRLTPDSTWHKLAVEAIIDDLWGTQSDLSKNVLGAGGTGATAIDTWVESRHDLVNRVEGLIGELEAIGQVDLAMLAVANRELRGMVAR
jgi:glutamate dehydrogenase